MEVGSGGARQKLLIRISDVGKADGIGWLSARSNNPAALKQFTCRGATLCRAGYLDHVRDNHHHFKIGELELPLLIQSATSMSTQEYLTHMRTPKGSSSWGGCLEVAVLAQRWRCRGVTFQFEPARGRAVAITYSGEDIFGKHHNSGKIAILWSGIHYDLILLSDELQ